MWDGGPERTNTGWRKTRDDLQNKDKEGLDLRIEKLNSHPCAQDF